MTTSVPQYCIDEVTRQGHDVNVYYDGGIRVGWMPQAWELAFRYSESGEEILPTLDDCMTLAGMVEPVANAHMWPSSTGGVNFRDCDVRVGRSLCPSPVEVIAKLPDLFRPEVLSRCRGRTPPGAQWKVDFLIVRLEDGWWDPAGPEGLESADEWYAAFEFLHPFRDGNGRTGKILFNWLTGTLENPVLMLDYFGQGTP
jgi:hypothetical protein